jgi:hypothetical protein
MLNPEIQSSLSTAKEYEVIHRRIDEIRQKIRGKLDEALKLEASKQDVTPKMLEQISVLTSELHECNRALQTAGFTNTSMQSQAILPNKAVQTNALLYKAERSDL